MENFTPISSIIGGALIGAAAVLLMATLGRIAGISGIAGGLATAKGTERGWRLAFLLGLIGIPTLLAAFHPDLARVEFSVPMPWIVVAGILVGLGTTIGNGCTSGHGVCGNARFSIRSIIATLTFMAAGIAMTFIVRHGVGVAL